MFHKRKAGAPPRTTAGARGDWRTYDAIAEPYARLRVPIHEPPARDLVQLVDVPSGGTVLDVGTGPGVAALAVEGARVFGVDLSFEMIRLARQRGLARSAVAAAVDLPFRDGTFDAVVSSFVLHLLPKHETALFDMVRVLRPGGRLGLATWAVTDDEFVRTWRELAEVYVTKEMLRDAQRRAAPWAELLSDPARVEEVLRGASLRDVRVERRQYRSTTSIEDYLAARETTAIGRFVRDMLGETLWERFRQRVNEEFRSRFRDPLGDTSEVLLTVATKER